MSERDVVIAALARILAGERADAVVPAVLASLGADAGNPVRARVAGAIYRASIFRLRLAFTAGLDGAALSADDAPALVDALDAQQMRAWPSDPFARLVVERSCPAPLARALVDALGHHGADAFLAASNEPGPKVLRANTLRTSRDVLAQRLLADHGIATSAGEHAAHALVVVEGPERARANLFGSRAWRDGWFEVQDQASQCVALATGAKPGDVVVDLCAGRGGKTVALAAMMQDRGALHVHDVDERALTDLAVREKRAGLTCLVRGLPREGSADVVLVDAPCSSTGVLRRSPDLRFAFGAEHAVAHVHTQRALLEQAAALVKPGGTVVYATCSVLALENEAVARASTSLALRSERRFSPERHGTDGFYLCVLARR